MSHPKFIRQCRACKQWLPHTDFDRIILKSGPRKGYSAGVALRCRACIASIHRPFAERFWERVTRNGPDDCWEWQGYRNRSGHGRINAEGYRTTAHRIAYILTYGDIPDGLVVCHRCDNPPCCNPSHLFLGTLASNNADRVAKGRGAQGSKQACAKLTEELVREIRATYECGNVTLVELAIRYGVTANTIGTIVRRKTWKHL